MITRMIDPQHHEIGAGLSGPVDRPGDEVAGGGTDRPFDRHDMHEGSNRRRGRKPDDGQHESQKDDDPCHVPTIVRPSASVNSRAARPESL
jgi:hypothetical protein